MSLKIGSNKIVTNQKGNCGWNQDKSSNGQAGHQRASQEEACGGAALVLDQSETFAVWVEFSIRMKFLIWMKY